MRILSVSDFHCGNLSGLTPPRYNTQSEFNYRSFVYRRNCWDWFEKEVKSLGKIDLCVANGDLIDGKGPKTGGNEQITQSRPDQIKMAVDVLEMIDAKEYAFTYGTGYHVGPEDDWEQQIADNFGASVHSVFDLNANGLIMKWRHHINGSQTPTGRATPLLRQQEWDALWSLDGEFERSNVMIFGHTHYFQELTNRYGTVIISPALQALGGSQLGERRLGGIVDYGFLHFDVNGKDDWSWRVHLLKQKPMVRAGSAAALNKQKPIGKQSSNHTKSQTSKRTKKRL